MAAAVARMPSTSATRKRHRARKCGRWPTSSRRTRSVCGTTCAKRTAWAAETSVLGEAVDGHDRQVDLRVARRQRLHAFLEVLDVAGGACLSLRVEDQRRCDARERRVGVVGVEKAWRSGSGRGAPSGRCTVARGTVDLARREQASGTRAGVARRVEVAAERHDAGDLVRVVEGQRQRRGHPGGVCDDDQRVRRSVRAARRAAGGPGRAARRRHPSARRCSRPRAVERQTRGVRQGGAGTKQS